MYVSFMLLFLFIGYGCAFAPTPLIKCKPTNRFLCMTRDNGCSRAEFLSRGTVTSLAIISLPFIQANNAYAFDGGVGGLGKTRPITGVVFRDPEAATLGSSSNNDDVTNELLAPDNTPAFVTFSAPWVSENG